MYASGLSMNCIARLFGVSTPAVLKWVCALGANLCLKIEPFPENKVIAIEVDEFWHYLKKKQKIWIFFVEKPLQTPDHWR
ncbi:MAG: Insertion element protein [Alphaproteobacteria bacterium]|nr:Insertion element protein [Alphaproteobacteria bacterium]